MEQKFYECEHCGKIVAMVKGSKAPTMCCGKEMKEIIPGTTDAAAEKHMPVYTVEGNQVHVTVGSVDIPADQVRQPAQGPAARPGAQGLLRPVRRG